MLKRFNVWIVGAIGMILVIATAISASAGSSSASASAGLPAAPAGLPNYFSFGLSNNDTTWMTGSGVPWNARYQYLSGGANTGNGWATWNSNGSFATSYINASRSANLIPVFIYYQILQSAPAYDEYGNLNNAATMRAYFDDFKLLMQKCATAGGTIWVDLEPDLTGTMQQQSSNTADNAALQTAAVASSGQTDVQGYPNNFRGVYQALVHLRDVYAPNVSLGLDMSPFGASDDIVLALRNDPTYDWQGHATRTATYLNSLGPGFQALFYNPSDRDAAWYQLTQGSNRWWDDTNTRQPTFDTMLSWLTTVVTQTGKRALLWQVPNGNRVYRTMNNTDGHYQDNRAEYFLNPTTGRAHIQQWANAGVLGILFGAGVGSQSHYYDTKGDGVTNPAAINGNTTTATDADDDGGYIRRQTAAYYAQGTVPLPGGGAVPPNTPTAPPSNTVTPRPSNTPSAAPTNTPAAGTPTRTATSLPAQTAAPPTATPGAGNTTVQGSITAADRVQTDRLVRDWAPSACAAAKSVPSRGDGLGHHADAYTYTNSSASSQCITVQLSSACTASNDVFSVAYLGAYNPANVQANYLADIGMSPGQNGGTAGYSFNVPAGQSFTVTVYEVTANAGCGAYTLTVTGGLGGGSIPPSATSTPRPANTTTAVPTSVPTSTAPPAATNTPRPTSTPPAAVTSTAVPATSTPRPTNTPAATATRTPPASTPTRTVPPATATRTPPPTSTAVPGGPAPLIVYADALAPGWADWSWGSSRNWADTTFVHSGRYAASCAITQAWAGLYVGTGGIQTTGYNFLNFYINGGARGGQQLTVNLVDANGAMLPALNLNNYLGGRAPAANTWQRVVVPLSDLRGANARITGVVLQDNRGGAQPRFYLDDMQFMAAP